MNDVRADDLSLEILTCAASYEAQGCAGEGSSPDSENAEAHVDASVLPPPSDVTSLGSKARLEFPSEPC